MSKVTYEGLKNVWYEGPVHKSIQIGNNDTPENVLREMCANHCSVEVSCDAYYIEPKNGANCHLVDERKHPNINRTAGHGWSTSKVYYVKKYGQTPTPDIPLPDLLQVPCDNDEFTLSESECNAFPPQAKTIYECPTTTSNYERTVSLISDAKCGQENRILQCELNQGTAKSNILSKEFFDQMFTKTAYMPVTSTVETLNYIRMDFMFAPVKITRVIIRTIDVNVERLNKLNMVIHSHNATNQLNVDLSSSSLNCAVMINFEFTDTPLAKNATGLELKDFNWWGFDPKGFKIDLFVIDRSSLTVGN